MDDDTRARDPWEHASIGRYPTRGVLGRGAMGTVYEGVHPTLAKRVAIKRVRLADGHDAEAQETLLRFRIEAQAAARLDHPNIVSVSDYGETEESAFIVMEFIDGQNLSQSLAGGAPMPLGDAVQVMDDILAGLAYSHARGVVHRDIKPANIMISTDGRAKIADFGIARLDDGAGLTRTGVLIGTPAYMSPEQLTGPTVDHRTDLYSAGVVFYQMLTGERPFEGGSASMMYYKVLNTTPPPPSNLLATLPVGLDDVVKRAMARRRDDRFDNAAEFAAAIKDALRPARPAAAADMVAGPALPQSQRQAEPAAAGRGGGRNLIAAICALVMLGAGGAAWLALRQPGDQTRPEPASNGATRVAPVSAASNEPSPAPLAGPAQQHLSPSNASICAASVRLQGDDRILDASRAGPACEAAVRETPNDPALSVLLGNVRESQQNLVEAARLYRRAADQGFAAGQNSLGVYYDNGTAGVAKDQQQAARLFRLAADQGNAFAQVNLGLDYADGIGGLPKDQTKAAQLYRLAADQGNAYGQFNLAQYYGEGLGGLQKDDREAVRLLRLAAEQGNAPAQLWLGNDYDEGLAGLPKDQREAARLYRRAADQGDATAENNLGHYYDQGLGGLPKDQREAARLYGLAADQGLANAQMALGRYYDEGLGGLQKDPDEAARLYRLAAENR